MLLGMAGRWLQTSAAVMLSHVSPKSPLRTEGEIFQGQLRAVPEEGAEEQEDDPKDGHRRFPLGNLADRSGRGGEYAGKGK